MLWRLIIEGIATWKDLQSKYWSLEDVEKANAVLDVREAIQDALKPVLPKGKP